MQFLTDVAKTLSFESKFLHSDGVVCDSFEGLADAFEADRYMGLWYEIYHSKGEPFQPDTATCV